MDGPDGVLASTALETELLTLVERSRDAAQEDPFGNPILSVTLALTRHMDRGEIDDVAVIEVLRSLGHAAILDRAARLRAYVGLDRSNPAEAFRAVAEELASAYPSTAEGFAAFRVAAERHRFAAVFTAHPTFGVAQALASTLASMASSPDEARRASLLDAMGPISFRPDAGITLDAEFKLARFAVRHARDAIDDLNRAILAAAKARWPDDWASLNPRAVALGSWVGCDTDGRTDIGWWDTLRYRLESKRGQLTRMLEKLPGDTAADAVRTLVGRALDAVVRQLAKAPPPGSDPSPEAVRAYALALVEQHEAALTDAEPLIAALDEAVLRAAYDESRVALVLARAGCVTHGLSIALPHFRLNASQLHNALRQTVALDGEPTEPAQRRPYLVALNAALDKVVTVPVDFGALAAERASASRMLMTIAQLVKHVDRSRPVRFLVAETETGYTLLCALWLACRFGIADKVEISPLFETAEALEQGPRIIEETLRSPHWQAYLKQHGRFCIQFGYSDSGRYIGQLAATFLIERLRLRICDLLVKYGLTDVELVIFDTHGESVGRGAHPGSLADRLDYLAPNHTRRIFAQAGIKVVRESSFQGTDGYLLFGSEALAGSTVARIAENNFRAVDLSSVDPIYDEPDFASEFFGTIRQEMSALVDDPGYAALIGTFGPALLDKTGSRPSARQSDAGGPARITHPRELRAIPNNAILQQLGWLANSVHGIGHAASRAPDLTRTMTETSERFARSYSLAERAMASSDLDVLRGYLDTLDAGSWFDRARRTGRESRRDELLAVATALSRLDLAPALRRMFGRLSTDWLKLRGAVGETPRISTRLAALHALRLAAIHRIWLTATHIPGFRPQGSVTREDILERLLRLDVPASLLILNEVFPLTQDPTVGLDFGEPAGPREGGTYQSLHRDVFEPMRRHFDLVREITGVIQHEIGAFG